MNGKGEGKWKGLREGSIQKVTLESGYEFDRWKWKGGHISWVFEVHWAKGQRHEDVVIGMFEG